MAEGSRFAGLPASVWAGWGRVILQNKKILKKH